MKIFKKWYRKSSPRYDTVWHRVCHVDSILKDNQMVRTVCGRYIFANNCEFDMNPNHKCVQCKKSHEITIETGHGFIPISSTPITTKSTAIAELKRLLKSRIYHVKIWKNEGVRIEARMFLRKSIADGTATYPLPADDVNILINIESETITKKRTKCIFTLEQIQADLDSFKSSIDCIYNSINALALKKKRRNGLEKELTETESNAYFEDLLYKMEK